MENNRPRGREKNITGQSADVKKRGDGLGTGPVGRREGYEGRTGAGGYGRRDSVNYSTSAYTGATSRASFTRKAGGLGIIGTVVVAVVLLLLSGKLGEMFGGGAADDGASQGAGIVTQAPINQGGGLFSGVLGSLMSGGAPSGSGVSTGWVREANTGKLDMSVASGSRAKYTNIIGGGRDRITMMVYMCGTDLESKHGMASSDLQEMAAAQLGSNIDIIVYTGGCRQWKQSFISNSVNQIYKVENGGLVKLVDNDGSDSMTKPATLTRFIKYCKDNYPADRYELIFWDHGGGSVSGYGYDEKNAASGAMSLKGINEALKAADTRFDFIGFDACLMATLETGLMLEPYADYMIASEETEPGVGWYYTNWLTALAGNTSMPTVELGKNIVDDFVKVCAQKCAGQKTTLSVVDLAELSNTVGARFADFASATSEQISKDFKTVSDARSSAREFAASTRIDQIDLVHLAHNLGTDESRALADAILGAVKYNRTSPEMTNCYGLSIFFPYRKSSKVDSAVATYEAIGLDGAYSRCIQQFAGMGVAGQAVGSQSSAQGGASPLNSLLGGSSGTGSLLGSNGIAELLGGLIGGGDLLSGLTGGSSDFFGRSLDAGEAAKYISSHQFNPNELVWTREDGKSVMYLSEAQWNLVHDVRLNVFYDDGEGYIDLGLDSVQLDFTRDGAMIGDFDGTWLAIDNQPVAYYCVDSVYEGASYTITGRVPVLLNGERAELMLVFTDAQPKGYIAGARYVYTDGETETVAKGVAELEVGDKIDFICDYYGYDGTYRDSYMLGEQLVYAGEHEISNVYLTDYRTRASANYLFTDIYAREYWSPVIK